jgi:hypothetical protein
MEPSANILIWFRIADNDSRIRVRGVLESATAVRVASNIYELDTTDWDDGLWDDEVRSLEELIDPRTDTVIVWQVINGKMVRSELLARD